MDHSDIVTELPSGFRALAHTSGSPNHGSSLRISCLGLVTWERLAVLRTADTIFMTGLVKASMLQDRTQWGFTVLLPDKSVVVMGDGRT